MNGYFNVLSLKIQMIVITLEYAGTLAITASAQGMKDH